MSTKSNNLRASLLLKIAIFFFHLLQCANLLAQNEDFASDRPGLSDAPDLINKKSWQLATGFDISTYNYYGNYQLSQNTIKYGISKRFEARLDFAVQYDPVKKIFGASSPAVGIKALLCNQKKVLPKTALIVEYYPPAFVATQQTHGLSTELCASNDFKNGNDFYYNVGVSWPDVRNTPTINALLGFSTLAGKKADIFFEFYIYKKPKIKLNYVGDFGFTYQLTKKLQLDFACGLSLVEPDGNFYFDGGISYNF